MQKTINESDKFMTRASAVHVALYIRALDIAPLKGDITPFVEQFEKLTASVAFNKVYLETHRDMVIPDENTLQQLKVYMSSKGIQTSAGITVTVNEMDDFKTYCYSNAEHREKIKNFVTYTAQLFDEILFDDFFFTNCKCPLCIEAKGAQSWTNFRLSQMTKSSIELVLEPARRANPNVKVMIKYPNWYEHFQGSGFNLKDQPALYDGIYTGNETRDAYYSSQHLQPYQSYLIFRYYENIKPGGNRGGWVDPAGATSIERYAQQIWLTLFAKAQEITLFDYHGVQRPIKASQRGEWQSEKSSFNFDAITAPYLDGKGSLTEDAKMIVIAQQVLKHVAPVLKELGQPFGLKAYKPHHSMGEDFLHNYIGMLGIPLDLVPDFPSEEPLIFLTESAAKDPEMMNRMKNHLLEGKNLIITSGLVKALEHKGFSEIAEIVCSTKKLMTDTFVMGWEPITYPAKKPIIVPQLLTLTNDVWEEVSCISGWAGTPLLTSLNYGNGKMFILTIPDNPDDLYQLPSEVLDKIRRTFISESIQVHLKETPEKVSLLTYDNETFVLASFLDETLRATVVIHAEATQLIDLRTGELISSNVVSEDGQSVGFSFEIEPQLYRAFKWK